MDIQKIFEITDFIDYSRWNFHDKNYNLINYYKKGLSHNTKLLTHWISYITDRQMPFKKIWDVGGFIFSNLIDELENSSADNLNLDSYLKPNGDSSFFMSREKYARHNTSLVLKESDAAKYVFVARNTSQKNNILKFYNFVDYVRPYFASRFYPSDYYSILSTLYILKDFNFQLTDYIAHNFTITNDNIIKVILFKLYLLTYFDIGQKKNDNIINYPELKKKALKRRKNVYEIINNPELFEKNLKIFSKTDIFKQKRAWCSLRDYLKSSFKEHFKAGLNKSNKKVYDLLFVNREVRTGLLKDLELPGDVWNSNSVFRKCLFGDSEKKINNTPKYIRDIYENSNIKVGYPEQFDITFDFVPRMCDTQDNCVLCPYGLLNGKATDFDKLCVQDKSMYCPILYVACNYKVQCNPDTCKLLEIKETQKN